MRCSPQSRGRVHERGSRAEASPSASPLPSAMPTPQVRTACEADAAAMAAIYAPYVRETTISFELDPPDAAEFVLRMGRSMPTHPWLVAVDGAQVIGYAYATRHRERAAYRWTAETSVYVQRSGHRRGVGRALYATLLERLAALNFRTALAGITLPNPQSVGFHESMGFRQVARYPRVGWKFGAWRDTGWWALELAPGADGAPAELRTPAEMRWPAP